MSITASSPQSGEVTPNNADSATGVHKGRQVKKAPETATFIRSGAIISRAGKATPIQERSGRITTVSAAALFSEPRHKVDQEQKEGINILVRNQTP